MAEMTDQERRFVTIVKGVELMARPLDVPDLLVLVSLVVGDRMHGQKDMDAAIDILRRLLPMAPGCSDLLHGEDEVK